MADPEPTPLLVIGGHRLALLAAAVVDALAVILVQAAAAVAGVLGGVFLAVVAVVAIVGGRLRARPAAAGPAHGEGPLSQRSSQHVKRSLPVAIATGVAAVAGEGLSMKVPA